MKQSLIFVFVLSLISTASRAQVNIYDDIDLGSTSGDLQNITTPGAWGVTHGTPTYNGTAKTLWMWNGRVVHNNQYQILGEGVFRRVDFAPGGTYRIDIGIPSFVAGAFTNANFSILLCNDPLPPNCTDFFGCVIPTFSSSRHLYTYSGGSISDQTLHLNFSTQASESYKYVVIYPGPHNNPAQLELTISCLGVYGCATTEMTYCSTIPGSSQYWRNVYIGSSFCSASGEAAPTSNTTTSIVGGNTIIVGPKSTLSTSAGNSFSMSISPCSLSLQPVPAGETVSSFSPYACAIGRPAGDPEEKAITSTGDLARLEQNKGGELLLYPNPVRDGIVSISIGNNSIDGNVSVQNVAGQVLKTISVTGPNPQINISDLPSGIYFIKAVSSNKVYTGRLVKR